MCTHDTQGRRERIGRLVETLTKLGATFAEAQAALDAEVESNPTAPGSQYFYDRDDAGVDVARVLPDLLALLQDDTAEA